MSNCDIITFPLLSWVRCGAWLYRFLIFALFLTYTSIVDINDVRSYRIIFNVDMKNGRFEAVNLPYKAEHGDGGSSRSLLVVLDIRVLFLFSDITYLFVLWSAFNLYKRFGPIWSGIKLFSTGRRYHKKYAAVKDFNVPLPSARGVPTCTQIRTRVQLDAASVVFFNYSKTFLKRPIKNRQKQKKW